MICAAVPTAKTLFIMSSEYETGRELVAATIALTTLASVGSLLAWLVLLAHLYPSVLPVSPGSANFSWPPVESGSVAPHWFRDGNARANSRRGAESWNT